MKIRIGSGTVVDDAPPSVTVLRTDERQPGLVWVRIQQKITLTFEGPCQAGGGAMWDCQLCGATPPLPDEEGARFILRNNDGGRILFPVAEDCEDERDSYPVSGWRDIDVDGERLLACKDCCEKVDKALKATLDALRRNAPDGAKTKKTGPKKG